MSELKDAWSNLIKLRATGSIETDKRQEIRNRLISNLQSSELPSMVREEFEAARSKLRSVLDLSVSSLPAKRFEFGLLPRQEKPLAESVSQSLDIPRVPIASYIEDKFEIHSIASKQSSLSKHIELSEREISVFGDISPTARLMSNMNEEDFSNELVHLLKTDSSKVNFDKISWNECVLIASGKVSFPKPELENAIEEPSEMLSELAPQLDRSIENESPKTLAKSMMPAIQEGQDDVDEQILAILETVGDKNIDLKSLLKTVEGRMANSSSMKTRMLYQFLLEYQKAKSSKDNRGIPKFKKPERKAPKPNSNQPKQQGVKTHAMREGWGSSTKPAVLNSRYAPRKFGSFGKQDKEEFWITGPKQKEEFSTENWTSIR